MTHDQLVVLIVVSFLVSFWSLSLSILSRWQKKHKLFLVLFRRTDSPDPEIYPCLYKSRDDVLSAIDDLRRHGESIFGVYSLIPDAFHKEFGGSILYDSKKHRR